LDSSKYIAMQIKEYLSLLDENDFDSELTWRDIKNHNYYNNEKKKKQFFVLILYTFFLVPGYGAQGGKAEDLKKYVNEKGEGIIVNSSRGIIFAYEKMPEFGPKRFAEAAREATMQMGKEIREAL